MLVNSLFSIVDLFARAGGGGSGGGSSGGSGGGGILALGYLPSYYATSLGKRRFGNFGALGMGVPTTIATSVILGTLFRNSGLGVLEVISAIAGFIAGFNNLHHRLFKSFKKNKQAISAAAALDPTWDEAALKNVITSTFMAYQKDWSSLNFEAFNQYSTERYAYHASLMTVALKQLNRVNLVNNPTIVSIEFSEVSDHHDNSNDTFTAFITASANDQLIDTRTNTLLFEDNSTFSENWKFVRVSNRWILDEIIPVTLDSYSENLAIRGFAKQENFQYSPDWGWLLLPKMGDIFSSGDFGKSDINNHCIGVYHNLLIQLYSYVPGLDNNGVPKEQYVVAQVAVPSKNYGRIIVRRKNKNIFSKLISRAPKGTEKFETESSDFNKKYDLYANNYEATTSFELLHPVYIEKMTAVPYDVELEVYENTIFIYSKDSKADYQNMFKLLKDAFEELKM